MIKQFLITVILVSALFTSSCSDENPLISNETSLVVWAFIYTDQPVSDIRLTSSIPLVSDSTYAPPINDANVALIKDGITYSCESSPGDSGYYHYAGNDLIMNAGDEFLIEIEIGDQLTTARTTVPDAPTGVTISAPVMYIPDFSDRQSMYEWRQSENADIVVSWDNPDNSWYYVKLKNIDDNPIAVDIWMRGALMRDFVFPPVADNQYSIRLPLITHLGQHEITVYKVNQEYLDLYESRDQDSRDLNEPLTNIENGLGVFSAFNSASVTLNVLQL